MSSQLGVAFLAASFLTSDHAVQTEVGQLYLTWLNDHGGGDFAQDCLLAAARCSKDPAAVLLRANEFVIIFD